MHLPKLELEDLLMDESFIRYVLGKTPADTEVWKQFTESHPEMTDLIIQAREIVNYISTRHTQPKHPEIREKVYFRLQQQIQFEKQKAGTLITGKSMRYYVYAASVLFIIAVSALLIFKVNSHETLAEMQFLEVIVPEGQRSQLILPDGSRVWLNSGSRFQYPVDFNNEIRRVYLKGEAYFDITHTQNDLPFTVQLNENLQIRVLGTEFNVKSYETDPFIEATLVKGSIRMIKEGNKHQILQEINLKPNEKATYTRSNQDLTITSLIPETAVKKETISVERVTESDKLPDEIRIVTAWKDEELVFHNESFEDIAIRMERWFGMKIRVEDDSLRKERFTGKFVNNESIYQILDIFNRSEAIQYLTKDKVIIITRKRKV